MGRILAIDYGKKRTGLAVTDTMKIVANGLTTVPTSQLMDFIKKYIATETVELIIMGEPKRLDNTPSENLQRVNQFRTRLEKELPQIPVKMWDERFTSTIAHRAIIDGGVKKSIRRNDKALVDTVAACIILNDYLQSNQF